VTINKNKNRPLMIIQTIYVFCPCGKRERVEGYTHRIDTINFPDSKKYTLRSLLDLHYSNANRSVYHYQIRYDITNYLKTIPLSDSPTLRKANKKFFRPNHLDTPLPDGTIIKCLSVLDEPANVDNRPKYLYAIQYDSHIRALDRI
jgi:hypothetical protein